MHLCTFTFILRERPLDNNLQQRISHKSDQVVYTLIWPLSAIEVLLEVFIQLIHLQLIEIN